MVTMIEKDTVFTQVRALLMEVKPYSCLIIFDEYRGLIRLQRIYNFLLFHAIILPVLDVVYIIFGTNLLTRGPTRIAIFLPISVFHRKGISNGIKPSGA